MANQHQYVKHSFPLKLELQVNVTYLSDFHHFTEERTAFILQDIEDEMKGWLLGQVTVKKILNKNTDCCTIGTVFEI